MAGDVPHISAPLKKMLGALPIPADLASGAGSGAGLAEALSHGDSLKKAGADAPPPEAFVEFQFAPGAKLKMIAPKMQLTDATFFINNTLIFGYKGNALFDGTTGGKVLLQFQTPLTPAGVMDFADFQFRMAMPDPRLAMYGGGFIRNIESIRKPLSVLQVNNPTPPQACVFGDRTKPFPTGPEYFNVALAGPLADGGPMIRLAGDTFMMGQHMGSIDATGDVHGFQDKAVNDMVLKPGPLGKVTVQKMVADTVINQNTQLIRLRGNFAGQVVEAVLDGAKLSLNVPANCVNPFEIKTQVGFDANTNIASVFDGQGGVNVDPAAIGGCIGKELQMALNKIAGEYKYLSGYSANQANRPPSAAKTAFNKAGNQVSRAFGFSKKRRTTTRTTSSSRRCSTGSITTTRAVQPGAMPICSSIGGP